jgi:energy-coupling factor transport system permease protein
VTSISSYFLVGQPRLHLMDPRSKLLGAMSLSILALRAPVLVLAGTTLFLLSLSFFSGVSLRHLYRSFKPAMAFVAILFLFQTLFSSSQTNPLFAAGPLRITVAGCTEGLTTAWRFLILLFTGALLVTTTDTADLSCGTAALLRPAAIVGISPQDIALMLTLALRFIPTLSVETEALREARAARGEMAGNGNIARRASALVNIAVPLCLAVFRRSDELVTAMEARGYDGTERTNIRLLRFAAIDWITVVLSIGIAGSSFMAAL